MPYNICYKIREDSEFSIKSGNGIVNLKVDSFSLIIDKKPEEVTLEYIISNYGDDPKIKVKELPKK